MSKEMTTRVMIVGEDPVVGRGLELLLHGADYDARFVPADSFDATDPADRADVLLLLTLGMAPERRGTFVSSILGTPGLAEVPILELVSSPDRAEAGLRCHVYWPCPLEELRRLIGQALLQGVRTGVEDGHWG